MNDFLQSLRNGQAEKQRTPKTRKNCDNSYQYSSGSRFHSYGGGYSKTRNPQMKRQQPQAGNQMPVENTNMDMMIEAMDTLATQVETLVKNQEYMIVVQERTADLLQRQADAIEMVMTHLNIAPDMSIQTPPAFENHYVSSQEETEDELDGTVEELLKAELAQEKEKTKKPAKPVLRKRRKVVTKPPAVQPTPGDAKLLPREEVMGIIDSMRKEGATYDQVAKRLIDLGQPTFSGRGEWHAQTIHRLCSKK
ncbi:MAG: hypothetical protein HUK40_15070 [Desulfobacter sp.]|nr:hypothetical protein [Desulfobacter sp.]WDP87311.1 MAG: hypothetical protein HUN05_21110 [Desulfobacter sp.]